MNCQSAGFVNKVKYANTKILTILLFGWIRWLWLWTSGQYNNFRKSGNIIYYYVEHRTIRYIIKEYISCLKWNKNNNLFSKTCFVYDINNLMSDQQIIFLTIQYEFWIELFNEEFSISFKKLFSNIKTEIIIKSW